MAARKKATKKKATRKKRGGNPTGKGGEVTKRKLEERRSAVAEKMTGHEARGKWIPDVCLVWGVSLRTVEYDIAAIYKRWEKEDEAERKYRKAEQRRRLFRLAAKHCDHPQTVIRVEELLAKLDGTLAAERVEVFDFKMSDLTDDQLDRIADGESPATVLAIGAASVH